MVDDPEKLIAREDAARANGRELHAGVGRRGSGLVPDCVSFLAYDNVVAGAGEGSQRSLVRHRTSGKPQRSFLAQQSGSALSVDAPATGTVAPPGYYMLYVLNQAGVPSVARLVRFQSPDEDTTPPGPPGTLTAANGVLRVVLTWGASGATDVVRYYVHRSTVAGFTPATANRIAQTAARPLRILAPFPARSNSRIPVKTRPGI